MVSNAVAVNSTEFALDTNFDQRRGNRCNAVTACMVAFVSKESVAAKAEQ
jgi:hypothetical protein